MGEGKVYLKKTSFTIIIIKRRRQCLVWWENKVYLKKCYNWSNECHHINYNKC